MRSSCGKYPTAYVASVVDVVMGVSSPPVAGREYTFQVPLRFDETSSLVSSAEKPAVRTCSTLVNCSMVYRFGVRAPGSREAGVWRVAAAAAAPRAAARMKKTRARVTIGSLQPGRRNSGADRDIRA